MNVRTVTSLMVVSCVLVGCTQKHEAPATAAPAASSAGSADADLFRPSAGIQDIMVYMIDPAADFLWEAVSTSVTAKGTVEKQPRTDEEWNEVRRQAILLAEGANLIVMEGRRVAREGKQLEDHGTAGNLTAEESEQAITANREMFVSFAHALHDVGESMLAAADARNPQGLVDAGDTLDQVCESCHLKFWYPGQNIPAFPDQAPETDKEQ